MRKLEVEWRDIRPRGEQVIEISHLLDGKNAKLWNYMVEIQLAEGLEDIVIESTCKNEPLGYEIIIYHLTRDQAIKTHKLLDGVKFDENFEFFTYGTFWNKIIDSYCYEKPTYYLETKKRLEANLDE